MCADKFTASESKTLPPSRFEKDGGTFLLIVDDNPEYERAVRYAARRARATGGHIALIRTLTLTDFQHWDRVEKMMKREMRREAESFLYECARDIFDRYGIVPVIYIEEGELADAVIDVLERDLMIRQLVLAASSSSTDPGPLVKYYTGKGLKNLRVPLVIVPGQIDDETIDEIS